MIAVRDARVVFGRAFSVATPAPVALPATTVNQSALLVAVHEQVAAADTGIDSTIPDDCGVTEAFPSVTGHVAPVWFATPAWFTVTVCPATVTVPDRPACAVFAATTKATAPRPVPVAPEATVIQETLLTALHVAVADDVVTVTLAVLAAAGADSVVALNV